MVARNRSATGGGTGGGFRGYPSGSGYPEATRPRPTNQACTEILTERERAAVRRIWWNQRALGFRLPAERGVIIMPGGAR